MTSFFATSDFVWLSSGSYLRRLSNSNLPGYIKYTYSFDNHISDVYFTDDGQGWVVGANGMIMYTENSNSASPVWTSQSSPPDSWLSTLYFLDELNGWIVDEKCNLLCTQSSGRSWKTTQVQMAQYSKIHFSDINNGWILSSESLGDYIKKYELQPLLSVLHTINSGVSWDLTTLSLNHLISSIYAVQSFKDKAVNFDGICFLNDKIGYLARHSKRILSTLDGGLTWNEQEWAWADWRDSQIDGYNSNINGFRVVQFIDSSRGWAISGGYGGDMLMKTTDGGKSCVRIETGFRL